MGLSRKMPTSTIHIPTLSWSLMKNCMPLHLLVFFLHQKGHRYLTSCHSCHLRHYNILYVIADLLHLATYWLQILLGLKNFVHWQKEMAGSLFVDLRLSFTPFLIVHWVIITEVSEHEVSVWGPWKLLIPVSHHGGRRICRGWEMLLWGSWGRDRNYLPQIRWDWNCTRVSFHSITKPSHYCSGWRTAPVLLTSS